MPTSGTAPTSTPSGNPNGSTAITGLHVVGNQLLNSSNQVARLLGVDRSGSEYACIQGWGNFDGPGDATSVAAMASWHINAVRIPLNEDCWLGINGSPAAYSGSNYQTAIEQYVRLLHQYGMAAILDLQWVAPGTSQATGQTPMPDQDHAPAFWQSVAAAFKGDSSALFDLFNEPYPDNNSNSTAAWTCLLNGGTCNGVSYQAAGTQELVNTIRATGATNVIMVPGVMYTNSLQYWLQYEPSDPQNNLVASWHSYAGQWCSTTSCFDQVVAPVTQQVPLVTGEIGENDCGHSYIDSLMNWLDSHGASYLAWGWDTYDCSSSPAVISNYNGTATAYGAGYQAHLAAIAGSSPTATPSATNTPVAPTSTPVSATSTPTATPVPPLPTPPSSGSTFGLTTVGSTIDTADANDLTGSQITTGSQAVTVQSISGYVGSVDSAPHNQYSLAIYADTNGSPGSLVAQSGTGTLTANSWNTLPITASLAANTHYWLVYNTNASTSALNNLAYNTVSSNLGACSLTSQTFGTWPSSFGTAVLGNWQFSLYATGTAGGSPTSTPVPPTNTPVPPTNTPVPPTNTPVPPTNTPVPPTNTPVVPTSTPTRTPLPPTNTPVPPTNTPVVPTATPVSALGLTSVGTLRMTGAGQHLVGVSVRTGSQSKTVRSLSAYVGTVSAAPYNQYSVAIYSNSNGKPGTLVAKSGNGTLTANGWNTLPMTATLAPNTGYWLVYTTNAVSTSYNNLAYNPMGSLMGTVSSKTQSFGSWPSTFGLATLATSQYSLYASVTP
jgi:hypothetical protein